MGLIPSIPHVARRLAGGVCLVALVGGLTVTCVNAGPRTVLLRRNSTSVTYDAAQTQWSISTGALDLTVGLGSDGILAIQHLALPGKDPLDVGQEPESRLAVGGEERWLQDGKDRPISFVEARTDDYRGGARLSLVFVDGERGARITRHYVTYPDAPSFVELWSEVERLAADEPIDVSVLAPWRVQLRARGVRWMRGLDAPADHPDISFQRQARDVGDGEAFSLASWGRSTSVDVPFVAVPSGVGTFVGGLLWSGTWQMDIAGTGDGLRIDANMRDIVVTVPADRAIESAHGFIGLIDGDEHGISNGVGRLLHALRGGRGFPRAVTYNPWFIHGTRIDEATLERELQTAAAIGIEVFQVDAGWYVGAGEDGAFDFTSGLGSYQIDTARFPGGLRPLGEKIRDTGMQFALWVEPERVDRRLVGRNGSVEEGWLATTDGSFAPGVSNSEARSAQICLSHPDAWQWVFDKLTTLIESNGVNYLKIDSNFWINCTREGHGHGSRDGNYWHVQGLYRLLTALRERFPDLVIENCAGGGNRIDLGLARYTDVAWMDDRTTPSEHVRHNLEGLLWFLPPSYLLGYAMRAENEPLSVSGDVGLVTRSRMPGVFGLSFKYDELSEFDVDRLAHEVAIYRRVRDVVGPSSYSIVLSQQTRSDAPPPWDVVEQFGRDTAGAVIFAFQNDDSDGVRVTPRDLQPDTLYELVSADRGSVGRLAGSVLMRDGFEIPFSHATRGHVFLLIPSGPAATATRHK